MKCVKSTLVVVFVLLTSAIVGQKNDLMTFTTSADVNQLLREAMKNFYIVNYDEGYDLVAKAQEKDPECAFAVLLGTKDADLQKALDEVQTMNMSSDERLVVDGIQTGLNGESSLDYFNQIFKKYPKDPQVCMWIVFYMTDLDESVACLKRIIKANKKFGMAYNLMGYKQMELNNMDEAQKNFDKYIALEQEHSNPYDSKGDWFMANNQFAEAEKSFNKSAALGMDISMKKAAVARLRGTYTEINVDEAEKIKAICIESEKSYVDEDFEILSRVLHDQAVSIASNNMVNVGKYNIKKTIEEWYEQGSFNRADIIVDDVIGIGKLSAVIGGASGEYLSNEGKSDSYDGNAIYLLDNTDDGWKIITTHYYESGVFVDDDETMIKKLFWDLSSLFDYNIEVTEEMIKKQAAYFMPQSIEIYSDNRSNIGLPNLEKRWHHFLGVEFEYAVVTPIKISGRGNKAIVTGVMSQRFKTKDSSEEKTWESVFTSILTKEDGDWKIQVWHWQ